MKNARAVYSAKRSITAGSLCSIAGGIGLHLRYLQLGGYVSFRYQDQIPKKGLTNPLNRSLLVVGAHEGESDALEELDTHMSSRNNHAIHKMLNAFALPWIEMYSSTFNYEKDISRTSKLEAKMVAAIPSKTLKHIKSAKTRYLLYNQSRRKISGDFMKELAAALSDHVDGVVIEHVG